MLWEIKLSDANGKITVQSIVKAFAEFLTKIFAFIADDQGWVEEETDANA